MVVVVVMRVYRWTRAQQGETRRMWGGVGWGGGWVVGRGVKGKQGVVSLACQADGSDHPCSVPTSRSQRQPPPPCPLPM